MIEFIDSIEYISDIYTSCMDELIYKLGKICRLEYAGRFKQCSSCNISSDHWYTGSAINVNEVCHLCNGTGKLRLEVASEEVKFLCSWVREKNRNDGEISAGINIPENRLKTVGKVGDLYKVLQCEFMIAQTDIEPIIKYKFKRATEPIDYGIVHGKYFSCLWDRIGGG